MKLLIDNQEHTPSLLRVISYEALTEMTALPTEGYSWPGVEDRIAIERKSLEDLITGLTGENEIRFDKEFARDGHYRTQPCGPYTGSPNTQLWQGPESPGD